MKHEQAATAPVRRIKQQRSRKTYDALISTCFKLLEEREFEAITIAELAQAAGYSVGAFYARFKSKDEFFEAMIDRFFEVRIASRTKIIADEPIETLVSALTRDTVRHYWTCRRFWRAALIRSTRDPEFWEPIRKTGHAFASAFIARLERHIGRRLDEQEAVNVRFGFQVMLGLINNAILNRPGPVFMGQDDFVENLARSFRLVSDFDSLLRDTSA